MSSPSPSPQSSPRCSQPRPHFLSASRVPSQRWSDPSPRGSGASYVGAACEVRHLTNLACKIIPAIDAQPPFTEVEVQVRYPSIRESSQHGEARHFEKLSNTEEGDLKTLHVPQGVELKIDIFRINGDYVLEPVLHPSIPITIRAYMQNPTLEFDLSCITDDRVYTNLTFQEGAKTTATFV